MKLNGITGTGSGKLGTSVFTTIKGVQVVRQYQPVVANPSSSMQVKQRSRFKLITQLAASLSNVIAMPRMGMSSSRNQFVKKNMAAVIGTADGAQVSYENLQLTSGSAGLPGIVAARASNNLTISLNSNASSLVSRVVYCIFTKNAEGQLVLNFSSIVSQAGEDGKFKLVMPDVKGDLAIYAYGIKDTSEKASAKFGDYKVTSASDVASLISNRSLATTDFTLTRTRGTTLFGGTEGNVTAGADQVMIYLSVGANGSATVKVGSGAAETVAAGKSYRKAVNKGESVVFTAIPASSSYKVGSWNNSGSGQVVSTGATYTVNDVQSPIDLTLSFASNNNYYE